MTIESKISNFIKSVVAKPILNSIKSFRNLNIGRSVGERMSQADFESGGWITHSSDNGKTYFDAKSIQQAEYQDGSTIFIQNQQLIRSKVFSKRTYIESTHPNVNKNIERELYSLGWRTGLMKQLFDGLYAGCGAFLILFIETCDGKKIKAIPFLKNGDELVRIEFNHFDEVKTIEIKDEKGIYHFLDLDNTDYYILYNIKIQDKNTYISNLTLASPFIATEVALLERDLNFARNGFTSIPVVSPKIEKTYRTDEDVRIEIGGVDYAYSDFLQKGFLTLKKQMEQEFKHNKIPIFPFPIDSKNITSDNQANQTGVIRKYLSEQIQIACFSNGSVTGRDNTANRSVGEQDRDNFEENTILIFQEKLEEVVNDFIIPKLVPRHHDKFKYRFYREATDESLRKRDQAQKTYEILVNTRNSDLLAKVGLSLNKEQIKTIFKEAHNIDLDDIIEEHSDKTIVEPPNLEEPPNSQIKLNKNDFFTNSIKSIDLSKVKNITYQDVFDTAQYKKIKSDLISRLKKQYQDFYNSNSIKVNTNGLNRFDDYMTPSEFKKALEEIKKITTDVYKDKVNKDFVGEDDLGVELVNNATDLHYNGGEVTTFTKEGVKETKQYQGFSNSQKERFEIKETLEERELAEQALIDFDRIEGNMILPLFNQLYEAIAVADGAEWVATVAKVDKLTRDWHLNNSNTAHKIGSGVLKDTTNPEYWLEPYCRCNVIYSTREDLILAGFQIIE